MTKPLYEIADNYLSALKALEVMLDAGEIEQNVFDDTLEGISADLESKVVNVVGYAKNLAAESSAIEDAIQAMTKRKKALDEKESKLIEYSKTQMERCGVVEIKCPYYSIRVRENPPRVVIDNESAVPPHLWRTIPATSAIDKNAIRKEIKEGKILEYAHLEIETRLEIK